ncbi:RNA polymerase II subunit A C-terminal domain phosphatase ssu72, partial [Sphaerulina musiva SO2202]
SGNFKLRFCTVCASNNNRSMEAHLRLTSSPQQYPVLSFGTGSLVRLPGASLHSPNVYNFNSTSYEQMYQELKEKDKRLYSANGILNMLERNKNIKWGPERWQDWRVGVPRVGKRVIGKQKEAAARIEAEWSQDRGSAGAESGVVDIVFTCEERCWDAVVDDLLTRGAPLNRPVHVFNVDIKDNHEEALVGGRAILELADALNAAAREERDAYTAATAAHAAEGSTTTHLFDQGIAGREGFDERVPEILAQWQEKWPHLPALWTLAWF